MCVCVSMCFSVRVCVGVFLQGVGGSEGPLQVPQNSLNSKQGPEQDREKASLARLSWFGSAAVGRWVFGSAVVTLSYTRVRVGYLKESG